MNRKVIELHSDKISKSQLKTICLKMLFTAMAVDFETIGMFPKNLKEAE